MVYCTVAYRGGLHRKITKNLWNMQMPDICDRATASKNEED